MSMHQCVYVSDRNGVCALLCENERETNILHHVPSLTFSCCFGLFISHSQWCLSASLSPCLGSGELYSPSETDKPQFVELKTQREGAVIISLGRLQVQDASVFKPHAADFTADGLVKSTDHTIQRLHCLQNKAFTESLDTIQWLCSRPRRVMWGLHSGLCSRSSMCATRG